MLLLIDIVIIKSRLFVNGKNTDCWKNGINTTKKSKKKVYNNNMAFKSASMLRI